MAKKTKKAVAQAMEVSDIKRYAPRITLTEDDIQGLSDLKVGETHKITITAELVALRKDEYGYDDQDKLTGTFRVKVVDGKDIENNYDEEDD